MNRPHPCPLWRGGIFLTGAFLVSNILSHLRSTSCSLLSWEPFCVSLRPLHSDLQQRKKTVPDSWRLLTGHTSLCSCGPRPVQGHQVQLEDDGNPPHNCATGPQCPMSTLHFNEGLDTFYVYIKFLLHNQDSKARESI